MIGSSSTPQWRWGIAGRTVLETPDNTLYPTGPTPSYGCTVKKILAARNERGRGKSRDTTCASAETETKGKFGLWRR